MQNRTKNNMNQLVTLSKDDIKNRVAVSNSFTKEEMTAHRDEIRLARKEKRALLGEYTGSNVGSIVDKAREQGAVVTDIKSRTSATQQTWTITMKAKVHKSEADAIKAKIARAQKGLNKLEEAYEKATATTV